MSDAACAGRFITVEGIDGCGKSTQARLLVEDLERAGYDVLALREPGGVAISEKIRALLLDPTNAEMSATCELLLYEAARAQLVHEVVAPALAGGRVVVCDRFYDSTTAYQGYAGGVPLDAVTRANELAVGACAPDLTLVFDIDPALAAERTVSRTQDRMEAKGIAYQQRVAEGFRAIAAAEPTRVRLIDAARDIDAVHADVKAAVQAVLSHS
ncbi:dTMP kinase [uncultured Enorma sp.]|uniref:dTMP kinase n=1 Tax=uncultured Enorma sp. TaxID=1714346 RepID=UPI0028065924|nr:dTMP kinase [uncultured Enorma sp.]